MNEAIAVKNSITSNANRTGSDRILARYRGLSDRLRDNDFFKESAVLPLQELAKQPYHFRWNDTGHAVLTEEDDAVLIQWLREYIWNKQL